MKLYSIYVSERIERGGIWTLLSTGDAIDVDGELMVRTAGGTILPSSGWHDTLKAAQAAAADRIAEIGRNITQQAECLREAARA